MALKLRIGQFLRLICASLILILFPDISMAQQLSEVEIKLSGDFFWGEGFGEDRETAINNAKRDLIEKLIVRIESDVTLTESETNDRYSADFESTTNSMSRMELRGLDYLPPSERPNGTWEAIAFVSKDDFEASMRVEEERLLLGLEQALNDEEAGRLSSAIPQYFDLLASTYFYPTPFFTNQDQHGVEAELQAYLRTKINAWLNGIDVTVANVRSLSTANNIELYFDLDVSYNDAPTGNLSFSMNRPGYAAHPVRNGKVEIFSDLLPDEASKMYVFNVNPVIPGNLDEDKINILENVLPSREVSIEIDFREVIDIDFYVTVTERNTFTFEPEVNNVSVFDLEWDFGDGNTSTETNPTHTFSGSQSQRTITLIINQSEELSKSKTIARNGEVVENQDSEPDPIKNSGPDEIEETNDEVILFSVPFSQRGFIDEIIRMRDGQNLTGYLNQLRGEDRIYLGRSSDVEDADKSYLAIINPDNRSVVAILSPVLNGFRTNLSTNAQVENTRLSETFRGYGSVWFQFK